MLPYYIFRSAQPGRSWELRVPNAIDLSRVVLFAKRVVDRAVTIRLSNVNVRSSFVRFLHKSREHEVDERSAGVRTDRARQNHACFPPPPPPRRAKQTLLPSRDLSAPLLFLFKGTEASSSFGRPRPSVVLLAPPFNRSSAYRVRVIERVLTWKNGNGARENWRIGDRRTRTDCLGSDSERRRRQNRRPRHQRKGPGTLGMTLA